MGIDYKKKYLKYKNKYLEAKKIYGGADSTKNPLAGISESDINRYKNDIKSVIDDLESSPSVKYTTVLEETLEASIEKLEEEAAKTGKKNHYENLQYIVDALDYSKIQALVAKDAAESDGGFGLKALFNRNKDFFELIFKNVTYSKNIIARYNKTKELEERIKNLYPDNSANSEPIIKRMKVNIKAMIKGVEGDNYETQLNDFNIEKWIELYEKLNRVRGQIESDKFETAKTKIEDGLTGGLWGDEISQLKKLIPQLNDDSLLPGDGGPGVVGKTVPGAPSSVQGAQVDMSTPPAVSVVPLAPGNGGDPVKQEGATQDTEQEEAQKNEAARKIQRLVRERAIEKVETIIKDIDENDSTFVTAFEKIKAKLENTMASSNLDDLFTECDIFKNLLFDLLKNTQGRDVDKKKAKKALEDLQGIIETIEEQRQPADEPTE